MPDCADCIYWKRSCQGVWGVPDWNGKDGGCGNGRTAEETQSTLEAFE